MTHQGISFQYLSEKNSSSLTSFSGLPLYMDLAATSGLWSKVNQELQTKVRGWSDLQIIMSLILLNIAGGDCVDDIFIRTSQNCLQPQNNRKTETNTQNRNGRASKVAL